jgi:hypothetical protein
MCSENLIKNGLRDVSVKSRRAFCELADTLVILAHTVTKLTIISDGHGCNVTPHTLSQAISPLGTVHLAIRALALISNGSPVRVRVVLTFRLGLKSKKCRGVGR